MKTATAFAAMGAAMVTTLLYARRKRCYMRLPPPLVAGRLG